MKGAHNMPTDFSDYTGLIPAGTVAVVQTHVRFSDGTDGVLKKTKNGDAEGLDLELTILEGQYAKQKLFWFALVIGTTDGQKSMAEKNLATLKRVIDSAKFLDPNDRSPAARKTRNLSGATSTASASWPKLGSRRAGTAIPTKTSSQR
jgi:hypothetical protein